MSNQKHRRVDALLAVAHDLVQVGDLLRVRILGEEIEALERLRILADPAARHVEAADGKAMREERLAEPGEKSPILEALEPVHEHDERLRFRRRVKIAADGEAFVREDS